MRDFSHNKWLGETLGLLVALSESATARKLYVKRENPPFHLLHKVNAEGNVIPDK
jgi:hypothetical protein